MASAPSVPFDPNNPATQARTQAQQWTHGWAQPGQDLQWGTPQYPQPARRRRAPLVLATLVVLALLGGGAWYLLGRSDGSALGSCGTARTAAGARQAVDCFGRAFGDQDAAKVCELSSRRTRAATAQSALARPAGTCTAGVEQAFAFARRVHQESRLAAGGAALRRGTVTVHGSAGTVRFADPQHGTTTESLRYEDGRWRIDTGQSLVS